MTEQYVADIINNVNNFTNNLNSSLNKQEIKDATIEFLDKLVDEGVLTYTFDCNDGFVIMPVRKLSKVTMNFTCDKSLFN